jgi:acyl carrier protein
VSPEIKQATRDYIVGNWLNGDHRGLKDDTNLQEAGLLDSITTLALVSFLEQQFAIQLDPGDVNAESFRTVDTIVALTASKMEQRAR